MDLPCHEFRVHHRQHIPLLLLWMPMRNMCLGWALTNPHAILGVEKDYKFSDPLNDCGPRRLSFQVLDSKLTCTNYKRSKNERIFLLLGIIIHDIPLDMNRFGIWEGHVFTYLSLYTSLSYYCGPHKLSIAQCINKFYRVLMWMIFLDYNAFILKLWCQETLSFWLEVFMKT